MKKLLLCLVVSACGPQLPVCGALNGSTEITGKCFSIKGYGAEGLAVEYDSGAFVVAVRDGILDGTLPITVPSETFLFYHDGPDSCSDWTGSIYTHADNTSILFSIDAVCKTSSMEFHGTATAPWSAKP